MNRRTFTAWLIGLFFGPRLPVTPPAASDFTDVLRNGISDTKFMGTRWIVTVRKLKDVSGNRVYQFMSPEHLR